MNFTIVKYSLTNTAVSLLHVLCIHLNEKTILLLVNVTLNPVARLNARRQVFLTISHTPKHHQHTQGTTAMGYSTINVVINNFIACITLNRPPANTINLAMREDLNAAFDEMESNPNVRVIVLTGAGEKGFCAGMDVADIPDLHKGPDAIELFNRIDRFPKPVIAMINGYALGGGCELALTCHFRFMTDAPGAVIGCPEVNLGITPGWGGIQRMARLLGRSRALELILLCKRLSPGEARATGLVDRVFPPGELLNGTMQFAQDLAKQAPLAVSSILKGMITGIEKGIDEGLKVDRKCSAMLMKSEDAKEGFAAFRQKRDPVFRGK